MRFHIPPIFGRAGVVAGFVLREQFVTVTQVLTVVVQSGPYGPYGGPYGSSGGGPSGEPVTREVDVETVVPSLVPLLSRGVLFAQAGMWRPASGPVVPAAPANAQSWLHYNSSTGLYWSSSAAATTSGDALIGWVVTNGTGIVLTSSRVLGDGAESTIPVPGVPVAGAGPDPSVVPVPPDLPTLVVGSEVGTRTLEQPLQRTVVTIQAAITLGTGNDAQWVTVQVSHDGGASWSDKGRCGAGAGVNNVTFTDYAPTSDGSWEVRANTGMSGADNPPTVWTTSVAFTVVAIALPGSNLISAFAVNAITGVAYNQVSLMYTPDGTPYWGLPDGFTITCGGANPNGWYLAATARVVTVGGVPASSAEGGLESAHVDEVEYIDGKTYVCCKDIDWWPFNAPASTGVVMRFEFWAYRRPGVSAADRVLQVLPGGLTYKDVLFGTPPAIGPALPTGVAISETGTRTLEQPLQRTVLTISAVITLAAGNPATWVNVWLSKAGAAWSYKGKFAVSGTTTITFTDYAPTGAESWIAYVNTGQAGAENAPGSTTTSNTLTVAAIALPGSNLISAFSVNAITGTAYNQVSLMYTPDGTPYWGLPDGFTITCGGANPNGWYLAATARVVTVAGVPASSTEGGLESSHIGEIEYIDGKTYVWCQDIDWWPFNPPASTGVVMRFEFWAYRRPGVSAADRVLQVLPGGLTYKDVLFGTPPAGALNMTRTDPATWGSGSLFDATGRPMPGNATDPNNMFLNPRFNGQAGWTPYGGSWSVAATAGGLSPFCGILAGGTSFNYIYQTFDTKPGKTYTVSSLYRTSVLGYNWRIQVEWLDKTGASLGWATGAQAAVTAGWQQPMSYTIPAAPTNAASILVMLGGVSIPSGNQLEIDSPFMTEQVGGAVLSPAGVAIANFAAGIRPVSIFTSNPTLPDANYPPFSFGYNITTPAFLKVNAAGTAWVAAVNGGQDIAAGTITATQIDATILNAAQVAAAYVTATYLAANYATITTLAATYATITALAAKTIAADHITTGTCAVAVSFTAPTIAISTANSTINIDATNRIKITALVGSNYSQLDFNGLTVSTPGSYALLMPGSLELNNGSGGSGGISLSGAIGSGSELQLSDSSGTIAIDLNALITSSPKLKFNGTQVIGLRQTGPGAPSFGSLANAQTWCAALLFALQTHGLVT